MDIKEILRIADTLSEETREYLEGAVTPRQPRTALRDILPRIKVFMTCKGRLFGIGKLSGGQDGRLTASLEYSLEYGEEPDLRWLPLLQSGCDGVFGISRRDAMDILDCINPYTERIVSRMPGRAAMDPDTRLSVYHRHPVAEQYVRFQGRISHADCNCLRFEIHLWRNTYAVITCVLPDTAADELYSEGERVTVEGRLTECRLTTDPGNIYCFDGCIFADTINK